MPKYSETTNVTQPTDHPARLSPVEHAGQAAVGMFGGGAIVTVALLATGVIGLAALPLAVGVVLALSASGFIVLAVGSLAHLGLYVAETLSHRDINGDDVIGDPGQPRKEIRLVTYKHWQDEPAYGNAGSDTLISESDLRWLVKRLDAKAQSGWQEDKLMGQTLPSGIEVDRAIYDEFIGILVERNWLVGRTERRKGKLMLGPDEIVQELGL